jgi:hypothetical protein
MSDMRRREFITLLGGTAVAWPLAANAQTKPIIGFLSSRTAADSAHLVSAFRQSVAAAGSIEAKDAEIVFRPPLILKRALIWYGQGSYSGVTKLWPLAGARSKIAFVRCRQPS